MQSIKVLTPPVAGRSKWYTEKECDILKFEEIGLN